MHVDVKPQVNIIYNTPDREGEGMFSIKLARWVHVLLFRVWFSELFLEHGLF